MIYRRVIFLDTMAAQSGVGSRRQYGKGTQRVGGEWREGGRAARMGTKRYIGGGRGARWRWK